MGRTARILVVALLLLPGASSSALASTDATASDDWYGAGGEDEAVTFYFVYSNSCPHCREAAPFVDDLEATRPWLKVVRLQVDGNQAAVDQALGLAESIGMAITGVPTFMFCEKVATGFDAAATTGAVIAGQVDACHGALPAATPDETLPVPVLGDIETSSLPLPVFTVVVAALDAFNPCAFFVLLFLLSLLVHTRSRTRMAVIGGTFVLVSGLLYFLFLVAWLNVFALAGHLRTVTVAAGLVAVSIGVVNLKDFAAAGSGPSLSIPERVKPGLFARMRALTTGKKLVPLLGATLLLAIVANSYELLCTAGLPMVFTRVLTMSDVTTFAHYGYVGLYTLVYVIPLLGIVAGFVVLFGSRKLEVEEGRSLKLLSGAMMLGLGGLMLFAPDTLSTVAAPLLVIGGAVGVTVAIVAAERWFRSGRSATGASG